VKRGRELVVATELELGVKVATKRKRAFFEKRKM
jgi:hypothetical protein